MWLYTTPQSYDFFLKLARISGVFFKKLLKFCKRFKYGLKTKKLLAPSGLIVPKRAFSIQYSVFFAIVTLFVVLNCK